MKTELIYALAVTFTLNVEHACGKSSRLVVEFLLLSSSQISQLGCQLDSLSPHPSCAVYFCISGKHYCGYIPLDVEFNL